MLVTKLTTMNICRHLKALLPYTEPFLFVDEFLDINENGARGTFTFQPDAYFYAGHFPGNPVTPGVILIEVMAQIGLVGLGMYLTRAYETQHPTVFVFTSAEVNFLKRVWPGETVWVQSEKIYFRLGKLKCKVEMRNAQDEVVCKGIVAGMRVKTA